jgi:hypothetical protein
MCERGGLPIDFGTGPLATNFRSAAVWLKKREIEGYAAS